jgi:D-glycero-alpha-D-manno-heptose-7-phosphate kinase
VIISKAPFRISFFGGGTDYPEHFNDHGGAVLGTAIDKCTYLACTRFYSKLFDYSIRLAYRQVECVNDLCDIQHAPLRECLRWVGISENIEIDCMAELPSSVGLGTSSSFVVGVLNALYSFQGRVVHPLDLAHQAIEIEREVLHEAVGCQDQAFAALGGFQLLEFRRGPEILAHRVPLSAARQFEFEQHLLMVFTGIRRRASHLAERQVQRVGQNLERLKAMRRMVDDGYAILTGSGDLSSFGQLLHRSWEAKASLDAAISNGVINEIYRAGREAGASGGKLLGAGGGGFMLLFVAPEKRSAVRAALAHLEEVPVEISAPGTRILHNEHALRVAPMTSPAAGEQAA